LRIPVRRRYRRRVRRQNKLKARMQEHSCFVGAKSATVCGKKSSVVSVNSVRDLSSDIRPLTSACPLSCRAVLWGRSYKSDLPGRNSSTVERSPVLRLTPETQHLISASAPGPFVSLQPHFRFGHQMVHYGFQVAVGLFVYAQLAVGAGAVSQDGFDRPDGVGRSQFVDLFGHHVQ